MGLIKVSSSSSIALALYYTQQNRNTLDTTSKQLASGKVFDGPGQGFAAEWIVTDQEYYKSKLSSDAKETLDNGNRILNNALTAMGKVKEMVEQMVSVLKGMMSMKEDQDVGSRMTSMAQNFFNIMENMQKQVVNLSSFQGVNMLTSTHGLNMFMDNFSTINIPGLQFLGTNETTGGIMNAIQKFLSGDDKFAQSARFDQVKQAFGGKSFVMVKVNSAAGQTKLVQYSLTHYAGSNNEYTRLMQNKSQGSNKSKSLQYDTYPYGATGTDSLHSSMKNLGGNGAGVVFTAYKGSEVKLSGAENSTTILDKIKSVNGGKLLEFSARDGIFGGILNADGTPAASFDAGVGDLQKALQITDLDIAGEVSDYGIRQNFVGSLSDYKDRYSQNLQGAADDVVNINPDVAATAKSLAATRLQISQQVVAFQVSNYGQSIMQIARNNS